MIPDCDIFIYPNGLQAVMIFQPPLSTDLFGDELLLVQYRVLTDEPGTTTLILDPQNDQIVTSTVTVGPVQAALFHRGDVDGNGECGLIDALNILTFLFAAGDPLQCHDAADVDDNGALAIGDAMFLLNFLFANGNPVDTTCGADPTPDNLPECSRPSC